jgi:hypothetical protein
MLLDEKIKIKIYIAFFSIGASLQVLSKKTQYTYICSLSLLGMSQLSILFFNQFLFGFLSWHVSTFANKIKVWKAELKEEKKGCFFYEHFYYYYYKLTKVV